MYDLITIYKQTKETIKYENLIKVSPIIKTDTKEIVTYAQLQNMRIVERLGSVSIKGSLAKYFLGNNINTLTRLETKWAIEQMQDDLGINLQNSNVYRIDIASNFIMKHPYKNYFDFLIDAPYTKKGYISDSVYFSNKQRQLIFYGKIQEMKDKGNPIPKEFIQYKDNMLRYEIRMKKRLKEQIGNEVKLNDLYEPNFFKYMVTKWMEDYFSVNKMQRIMLDRKAYSTPKNYKDYLLLKLINEKGIDNILNDIDANRKEFNSSTGATRCKTMIKELTQLEDYSEPNELIEELNEKVKVNADYFLSTN